MRRRAPPPPRSATPCSRAAPKRRPLPAHPLSVSLNLAARQPVRREAGGRRRFRPPCHVPNRLSPEPVRRRVGWRLRCLAYVLTLHDGATGSITLPHAV